MAPTVSEKCTRYFFLLGVCHSCDLKKVVNIVGLTFNPSDNVKASIRGPKDYFTMSK